MQKIRERAGVSQAKLAERLGDLGLDYVGEDAIGKIEKAERNVSVDEHLAIALALGVPPHVLLVPWMREGFTSAAPAFEMRGDVMSRWLRGISVPTSVADYSPDNREAVERLWRTERPDVERLALESDGYRALASELEQFAELLAAQDLADHERGEISGELARMATRLKKHRNQLLEVHLKPRDQLLQERKNAELKARRKPAR